MGTEKMRLYSKSVVSGELETFGAAKRGWDGKGPTPGGKKLCEGKQRG